ncbi:hypothetical protein B8W95_13135, partial [Staphylococcus pasteuri]
PYTRGPVQVAPPTSYIPSPYGGAYQPAGLSQQQQQQNKEQEQGSAESEDPQKIPLTQKVKYLFRKYGWTTLVVYLGLSAVDFGLCFLVIYSVG